MVSQGFNTLNKIIIKKYQNITSIIKILVLNPTKTVIESQYNLELFVLINF